MKYVSLFAVGAVASLVPRAEVDTIKDDISTIRDAVQAFTSTMQDYSEDDMDTVRTDLRNIILAVNAADSDTKALKGPFSDHDAGALATPIQDLGIDIGKAMDALIAKKSALVAKCHGPEIYQALVDEKMQSAAFQTDFMKRLSPDRKTLATEVVKPFNANIARGVIAFEDQQNVKCPVPKYASTSSVYGSGPSPTGVSSSSNSPGSSSPASSSPAANSNAKNPSVNTGLTSSTSNQKTPDSSTSNTNTENPNTFNANTQNPNSSNSITASNSTVPSYTAGPAPTSSIVTGSASAYGASLVFAGAAALAFFAL